MSLCLSLINFKKPTSIQRIWSKSSIFYHVIYFNTCPILFSEMASAAAELVVERELESRIEMADTNRTFVGAQGLVKMALDQYTEILTTVSDPRVSDWPLMDSPIPTFLIVLLYLYGVTILGPRVMANRKPFKLRGTLLAYNAFQVIFSLGMLYEVRNAGIEW